MAKGGFVTANVEFNQFFKRLDVALSRVERGTKKATIQACEDILKASLKEVPRDTGALAESAGYEIEGSYKNFTGRVGYGMKGGNGRHDTAVADYMVAVHEDLSAVHPNGKAKFLEDPVNAYRQKFPETAALQIRRELR